MNFTTSYAVLAGIFGSATLLIIAIGMQYFAGLYPCELCLWQRWPHGVAIISGFIYLICHWRLLPILCAVSMAVGTGLAIYHVGVENDLWSGLASCTGAPLSELSGAHLLDLSISENTAQCSEVMWDFLGISMAGWNGIFSCILAIYWTHTGFWNHFKQS